MKPKVDRSKMRRIKVKINRPLWFKNFGQLINVKCEIKNPDPPPAYIEVKRGSFFVSCISSQSYIDHRCKVRSIAEYRIERLKKKM